MPCVARWVCDPGRRRGLLTDEARHGIQSTPMGLSRGPRARVVDFLARLAVLAPSALITTTCLAGCDRRGAPVASTSPPTSASNPSSPPASSSACGDLPCAQYPSAREAFLAAVRRVPGATVIGVGEAHAQKDAKVPSAVKRFSDEILPSLEGRASDLLVELMMPPVGCSAATSDVRQKQAPATSQQAPTNQNEYVALGEHGRLLHIVPDLLRPTCADLDAVRDAGDEAIDASLRLIARLCETQALRLVERDARSDEGRGKAVVIYSGMLHNDLSPPPERAAWSYAPALDAKVGAKLVSIDLVVPEFIGTDATWTSLPWVSHYDRTRLGSKPTLIEVGERSFVLVFAEGGS